ncbi:MAG: hypothetical protein AAGD04_16920 [Pseudomonadota bacterium]
MRYPFENAQSCKDECAIAKTLPRDALVAAVFSHSWDDCVVSTMGAIADREDCPLLAVLFMFDLGAGEYSDAAEFPEEHTLFKRIQDRINAGGYTHFPEDHLKGESPHVESYLRGTSGVGQPWALDPKIVQPALDRPDPSTLPLTAEEEQLAQDFWGEMKAAGADNPVAIKMLAVRAVAKGRRIENRVLELIAQDRKKQKAANRLKSIRNLWPFAVAGLVSLLLFYADIKRILFG